jgi:NSS family neurotransmitter:Na+ symporter
VQANAGILATIDGDAPSESRPRKSVFSSKLGFVLAAAGSAVGLGNVWRFPYFAATYGGGTFLFAYLLIALTFGIMLLIAEVAIGRATGHGPVAAFRQLDRRFTSVGVLAMLVPAIIFPFYSVIGGWVTRYAFVFLTGGAAAAAETGAFGAFTSQTWGPIGWLAVFILATAVLVARGINKGIERINLITMPIFIVMLLGLAIYTLTLPGGTEGLRHFLLPDFSELSANTFIAATRQSFFSLSLASGVMVAYGSYMKKSASIEKAAFQIGVFDTTASIIAGLLVIPAVVAIMGIDGLGQGAGLLFATLPHVFASMPGGAIVGAIFFVLMLGAAVTSSISMLEVVVNSLMDRAKWSRLKATVVTSVGGFLFGLPVTLGFGVWSNVRLGGRDILGMMNFLTDTVMMPLVGLGTVLVVGWVIGPQRIIAAVHQDGQLFRTEKMFVVLIKWVGPALLTGLVATSFLMAFGVITL